MFFKRIKSALSDYFTLTTRERRGSMWLLLIITAQLCWLYYDRYEREPEVIDLDALGIELIDLHFEDKERAGFHKEGARTSAEQAKDSLFTFDPNTVTEQELMLLGLSEKQSRSILNFRTKGGRFRKAEDFEKMYAIPAHTYLKLKPYISISIGESQQADSYHKPDKEKKEHRETALIELNTATAEDLDKLPMIGLSRAERIIKYREALGGFINIEQLKEVFGIDSTVFAAIENRIRADPSRIRLTRVNDDSLRHPYLPYKLIKVIREYRKQHGNFTSVGDMRNITLFNDDIYRKIAPYLTAE
jgi:competence protein ComEA